jgi:plasmid stability protein
MARLTITLPDELHRALKEAAARRGRTIGDLVAESLDFYGIKSTESARDLITRARERAQLTERQAVKIATVETRRVRHR